MLYSIASWLQALPPIELLRVSSWAYPLVSALHIAGFALLFGAIAVVDLRLLRTGRIEMTTDHTAIRIALAGFTIAACTGAALLAVKAVEYVASSLLWWKFAAIAVGGVNAGLLHSCLRRAVWPSSLRLRLAGLVSVCAWSCVILCGRLLGFL